MITLAKIRMILLNNHKLYSETENIELLEKNIELFLKVKGLKKEVNRADQDNLFQLNKSLFIIAEDLINYAYVVKDRKNSTDVLSYIHQASNCYKLICDSIRSFPRYNLPKELSSQLLRSEFYSLKTEYHIARLNLYFINKNEVDSSEELLSGIINTLEKFESQLTERYKDFAKKFKTQTLLEHVKKALTNAQDLLERLQQTKTNNSIELPRDNSVLPLKKRKYVQDDANSSTLLPRKTPVRKNRAASISAKTKESARSESPRSETKQASKTAKPVRTKRKRIKTNKGSLAKSKDSAHSASSKSETKQASKESSKPVRTKRRIIIDEDECELNDNVVSSNKEKTIGMPEPTNSPAIAILEPSLSASPYTLEEEEDDGISQAIEKTPLDEIVSTSYTTSTTLSSFSLSTEQTMATKEPATNRTITVNSPQGFWTSSMPCQNIKKALQDWEAAYFKDKEARTSAKKSSTLEKLAHSLLLEAVKLQNHSEQWSDLKNNPAIVMAVHLLLKSAEANPSCQSERDLILGLKKLSERYEEQLGSFILTPDDRKETYLDDLVALFSREQKPNLHARSVAEITDSVFKYLREKLTEADYQTVHEGCLTCIQQATRKIEEKMQLQSREEPMSVGYNP